jgi:hypothetical protein
MTFYQLIEKMMADNGMFDTQIKECMPRMDEHEALELMRGRMSEDQSAYPAPMANMILMNAKIVILEYIDEKCPEAWFRPCFLPQDQQQQFMKDRNAERVAEGMDPIVVTGEAFGQR